MPPLSAVRASNQAWKPPFRPVVVVAGGTNGIGAGIATAFAKYAPKDANAPHIIIIGRSRPGADSVIAELKKLNAGGKYEFVQADLTLMKSVKGVAKEIASKVDKINYLCMSPGILSFKGKDDTEEGIDRKMALNYYARFLLGNMLIPKLDKAVEKGEEARVMTVLAAGQNGSIDLNDLGLKKDYGMKRKADAATTYNDLAVEEFAKRHPKMAFTHAYPGLVNTNILHNLPFYARIPAYLALPFTTSVADCADWMIYNLLRPEHKTGAYFVTNKGDHATKNQYFGNDDVRKKVWDHSVEVTGLESAV